MDEPSSTDILFWDLARKSTKICYTKCVLQVHNKLTSKQEGCIRECTSRYVECRDVALNSLKDLAKHG